MCLSLLVPGCFADSGGETAGGSGATGVTSAPGPSGTADPSAADASDGTSDMSPTTSGSSTEGDHVTGGAPKLDLPLPDAPPMGAGCRKVDLLFVIDNSLSMAAEQDNLIQSFPGFITGIQTQLEDADSYHVGVVTTDAYANNEGDCHALGGLVTDTKESCGPFASGGRYMSEADDLTTAFACAAYVGLAGDNDEQPVAAAQAAISEALAGPGACNEGFFRDDALLVVTLITDEEDDNAGKGAGSPGDPPQWFEALVARKSGIETHLVVLAVVGGAPGNMCPPYSPPTGAEESPRLVELAGMFTYGSVGDVCADSYDGFFQAAIAAIDTACDNFTPPD